MLCKTVAYMRSCRPNQSSIAYILHRVTTFLPEMFTVNEKWTRCTSTRMRTAANEFISVSLVGIRIQNGDMRSSARRAVTFYVLSYTECIWGLYAVPLSWSLNMPSTGAAGAPLSTAFDHTEEMTRHRVCEYDRISGRCTERSSGPCVDALVATASRTTAVVTGLTRRSAVRHLNIDRRTPGPSCSPTWPYIVAFKYRFAFKDMVFKRVLGYDLVDDIDIWHRSSYVVERDVVARDNRVQTAREMRARRENLVVMDSVHWWRV